MRVRYNLISCGDESRFTKSLYCRDICHRYSTTIILILSVITIASLYLTGVLTYLFEKDFTSYSTNPSEIINLRELVEKIDRYGTSQQAQNALTNYRNLDLDFINQALNKIKTEEPRYNVVVPLDQFQYLQFLIDANPNCLQQWGPGQIRSTLLSESSQKKLISVIVVVKSAVNNYARRSAIRKSWYLSQTIDVFTFKTVFMVGKCKKQAFKLTNDFKLNSERSWLVDDCSENIKKEAKAFGDIVQSSGIDAYYNNTIKTYMTLRWLNERCPSDLILAVDDDYVLEVENLIEFLNNQAFEYMSSEKSHYTQHYRDGSDGIATPSPLTSYPLNYRPQLGLNDTNSDGEVNLQSHENASTLMINVTYPSSTAPLQLQEQSKKLHALRKLLKQYLWAGYLRNYVHPIRSVLSKWYISRDDYAFNKYPPFITGGAVLMSFKTIKHLYYASYFTQAFKFDDVYIGILAYRLNLIPLHSDNFMCTLSDYLDANPIHPNSTSCIGVHDIDPEPLVELWQTRKNFQ